MPKSLSEHTEEEKATLMKELKAVYEKHGNPKWLKGPSVYTECVNILNAGQQQVQEVLKIEGKAPLEDKEIADKIKAEVNGVCAGVVEKEIEIGCSYGVGIKMGVIEGAGKICVDKAMFEGEKVEVKHEKGQVLLLDFWATWCPPCQKPMAHNQEMLDKRADWGDKVRLIGLSIDQDVAKLKAHVNEKKWTSVEHYWVRNGACTASDEYGVQGVPHVLLIDTDGVIVFMGHPANRDIEKDIDALLKGEKLTGAGCEAAGGDAEDNAASDSKGTIADVEKFKAETKDWVVTMKDRASKLQRAFLVMTCDQTHNFSKDSVSCDITVHTVIMGGEADDKNAVHEECKKKNQGPWKNRD
jgi:thiol-disulfide isomerase/thioredoxin